MDLAASLHLQIANDAACCRLPLLCNEHLEASVHLTMETTPLLVSCIATMGAEPVRCFCGYFYVGARRREPGERWTSNS